MTVSEHDHQVVIFKWAELRQAKWPELALLHAIPNGGHRHKAVAIKLKLEGVKKGMCDISLPIPRGQFHGCYIELKTEGGKPTKEQNWWLARLVEQGCCARLIRGSARAIEFLEWYLSLDKPKPIWLEE